MHFRLLREMKVPKEIREVERPTNTVVYAYADKNAEIRYGVKERIYWKEDGRQKQKDGRTIGYILNGRFVPLPEDTIPPISYSESDMLYWGPYQLIVNLSQDIWEDLLRVYNPADAEKIYSVAVLRTADNGLKDYELKDAYDNSYLTVLIPDVALSKDTVGRLLYDLGRTCSRVTKFMVLRSTRVPHNHLVAIDGMLKSYESENSIFSDYSRKARINGSRDVSVIMAYDVEAMEPVCSTVFRGNLNDASVFREFLETNGIAKGIIITDKGFRYSSAKRVFLDNPNLHFLIPLERDSAVISQYRVLSTDITLANRPAVAGRKIRMNDGLYLYAFRDTDTAYIEEKVWLQTHPNYNPLELSELRKEFGSIVFISDLDAPPEVIYASYEERWELEVLFRFYKHILDLDETCVESDQSTIGTEFVNFLSMIMLCRLRKAFYSVPELCGKPFKANMKLLRKGIMMRESMDSEWKPKRLTSKQEKAFMDLGIIEAPKTKPKKRGRPKGSKNKPKVQ